MPLTGLQRAVLGLLAQNRSPDSYLTLSATAAIAVDACEVERLELVAAALLQVAAAGALGAAGVACAAGNVAACMSIPFLAAAYGAAVIGVALAHQQLSECMGETEFLPPSDDDGSGEGPGAGFTAPGGTPPPPPVCVTLDWYVSYDGGQTWTFTHSERCCF